MSSRAPSERGEPPFVLVLDLLEDPQNVGTLLRSAEAVGVHGVVFPTHRQAPLSPVGGEGLRGRRRAPAARARRRSAGRARGSPRPRPARRGRRRGRAARRAPGRPSRPDRARRRERGPGPRHRRSAGVRLPRADPDARRVGSLNAAVAGSVLLFEVLAQRPPAPYRAPAAGGARDPQPTARRARRHGRGAADAPRPNPPTPRPRRARTAEPEAPAERPPEPGPSRRLRRDEPTARRGPCPRRPSLPPRCARPRIGLAAPRRRAPQRRRAHRHDAALAARPPDARDDRSPGVAVGRTVRPLRSRPTVRPRRRPVGCGVLLRADVAQLVEQRFCKPPVPGSSPVVGSN